MALLEHLKDEIAKKPDLKKKEMQDIALCEINQ